MSDDRSDFLPPLVSTPYTRFPSPVMKPVGEKSTENQGICPRYYSLLVKSGYSLYAGVRIFLFSKLKMGFVQLLQRMAKGQPKGERGKLASLASPLSPYGFPSALSFPSPFSPYWGQLWLYQSAGRSQRTKAAVSGVPFEILGVVRKPCL